MAIPLRRTLLFGGPILWIAVANLGPLLAMARISLLDGYPALPGHTPAFTFAAYRAFLDNPSYQHALMRSLVFATLTTVGSLVLCYPLAYLLAVKIPADRAWRRLALLVMPFWTSEIVRIFAIAVLLSNRGAVNLALSWTGLTDMPLHLLYGRFSVTVGMMYVTLLSMLLPIYAALDKLPRDLLHAATVFGAGPWRRLVHITVPLSAGGIATGCGLVFLLSLGTFAVPVLLGGPDDTLFAVTIAGFFASAANRWPMGAAFGLILLAAGGIVSGAVVGLVRARPASP